MPRAVRAEKALKASAPEIPNKLFFKIGEVCDIVGVESFVLRFWETEFPMLEPERTDSGHRVYRRRDVELLLRIKELLYKRRMTIEGARKQLGRGPRDPALERAAMERLVEVRAGLREILTLLKRRT